MTVLYLLALHEQSVEAHDGVFLLHAMLESAQTLDSMLSETFATP